MIPADPNSPEFGSAIADEIPDAIIWVQPVHDAEGSISDFKVGYANRSANRIINHPRGPLPGLFIRRDGVPTAEAGERNYQHFLEVYRTVETRDFRFTTGEGREMETVRRIYADGVLSITRDRRAQREAERKEREQTELLNGIIRNAPAGIEVYEAVRDAAGEIADFEIRLYNEVLHELTGIPEEARRSLTFRQLLQRLHSEEIFERYRHTAESGEPFTLEYFVTETNAWIYLSVVKLGDGFLIIISDYTALRQTQQQLEQTVAELRRSNQSLEEFAYAASHDLQEPLRKINTFSQQLRQELAAQLNDRQQDMFHRIGNATRRMRHLIEDLLAYAQVGMDNLNPGMVDLKLVVQQVLQDLETSIQETGARISADPLPVLQGDERQLRQLFHNLLGNALKYRVPGRVPEIELRCSRHRSMGMPFPAGTDYFDFEIRDNGIGFHAEHSEKIFQVFQRLHGRNEYEGTGVGLAIVQKVLQNHRGRITAEGKPGEGALFRVQLPV